MAIVDTPDEKQEQERLSGKPSQPLSTKSPKKLRRFRRLDDIKLGDPKEFVQDAKITL
jgi:hypothetical protein